MASDRKDYKGVGKLVRLGLDNGWIRGLVRVGLWFN